MESWPLSLLVRPSLPVRIIRRAGGPPEIVCGAIPSIPFNGALRDRAVLRQSSRPSLGSYAVAAAHLLTFAALRGRALAVLDMSDIEAFAAALLGQPFRAADGSEVLLPGSRRRRTSDRILIQVDSMAEQIERTYGVRLGWRQPRVPRGRPGPGTAVARPVRIAWGPTKVLGLPDEEFQRLLVAARDRWADEIADGDRAHAPDPEAARGALFWRNVAMLFVLRYAGARRAEVPTLDLEDIDPARQVIHLATKGRLPGARKEPVVLLPQVREAIFHYLLHHQPVATLAGSGTAHPVFVSHSVRNYGQRIGSESVRKVIDVLRPAPSPGWRDRFSAHTLRHAFGYDLQVAGGEYGVLVNMRHRSYRSGDPYRAGVEQFVEELDSLMRPLASVLEPIGIAVR